MGSASISGASCRTLLPLQELGCLEFADAAGWGQLVLAGDVCSAIRVLFLIHDPLLYKRALLQRNQVQLLASKLILGAGTEPGLARVPRGVVEWSQEEAQAGLDVDGMGTSGYLKASGRQRGRAWTMESYSALPAL